MQLQEAGGLLCALFIHGACILARHVNNSASKAIIKAMSTLYRIAHVGTKNISERAFVHTQNTDFGSIFVQSDAALLRS